MHSKSFEIAMQQALGNAIVLTKNEAGSITLRVAKTTGTFHKKGKFELEINESGVGIIPF